MAGAVPAVIPARVRAAARQVPALRSAVYLTASAWLAVADTPDRNRQASLGAYAGAADPWNYESPWGREHVDIAERLIAEAAGDAGFDTALELGCGEGWTTQRLARHARSVVAVDLSPVAIERAQARSAAPSVRFEVTDVMAERVPGRFEFVVSMGFIEIFRRPDRARRARQVVLDALAPGGQLLVSTVRQHPVVEEAAWASLLPRGARGIDRFLRAGGHLRLRRELETETHLFSIYAAHC